MSIRDGVTRFNLMLDEYPVKVLKRMAEYTEQSVKDGGVPETASQGIPVAMSNAKQSVIGEFEPGNDLVWRITATGKNKKGEPVGYVPIIEANIRGVTFKNGGPHFFSATIAGLPALFERSKREVLAEG